MTPRNRLLLSGGLWSPLALLIASYGAWFDPSDLSTMWQDNAGTIPAAVDQQVGRMVDKSGRIVLTQTVSSSRPILRSAFGLYWLEFDGLDDTLTGVASAYGVLGTSHYEAATVSRSVEANSYIISVQNSASVYHRLQNASLSTRANARTQDGTNTLTVNSAVSSWPLSTIKVLDSLVVPTGLDAGVNGVLATSAGTWLGIGAAQFLLGQTTTTMNFYGGVTFNGDPGPLLRAKVQQVLAAKGGISF